MVSIGSLAFDAQSVANPNIFCSRSPDQLLVKQRTSLHCIDVGIGFSIVLHQLDGPACAQSRNHLRGETSYFDTVDAKRHSEPALCRPTRLDGPVLEFGLRRDALEDPGSGLLNRFSCFDKCKKIQQILLLANDLDRF